MAFGFTAEQVQAWMEAQAKGPSVKTTKDVDVSADDERLTEEELIKDALTRMRLFNEALAALSRRGVAVPLELEQPEVIRRRLTGRKTHNSPESYDAVFVRPSRVTARGGYKPAIDPAAAREELF